MENKNQAVLPGCEEYEHKEDKQSENVSTIDAVRALSMLQGVLYVQITNSDLATKSMETLNDYLMQRLEND